MPDREASTLAEHPLPDGRRVTVRRTRPEDLPALVALFEGLPTEDIRCRFFTPQVPPVRLFERWLDCAERGGLHLLATVTDGTDESVIAEAGYFPCDGDAAEFAIAVAPRWRGWLGPYLFDLLCREAHERGVANLEADVLATNSRMFALLRRRGYVTLDHEDFSVVRVLLSSGEGPPGWPDDHGRPRVLVEVPGGRWWAEAEARRAGLRLIACPGPARCGVSCPATRGEPCPLVQGADAVVIAFGPEDPVAGELLAAHRRQRRGLHVVVRDGLAPPDAHTSVLGDRVSGADVVARLTEIVSGAASS